MRSVVTMTCLFLPALALAEKPRFDDTFSFALGGISHQANAKFSSTKKGALLDKLSLKDLGMDDDTTVVWVDFDWQFLERWKFNLSYSSFDAEGFNSVSKNGNFDGLEWEVGASLTSSFNTSLLIADLHWDFLKTNNAHLGAGLGFHVAEIEFDLLAELSASIGGSAGTVVIGTETKDITAPLPNVNFTGGVMVGKKVYLSATAGYFSLKYNKYNGELLSFRGAAEWRPWGRLGIGVAYQYVNFKVDVNKSAKTEQYIVKLYGPILFLSVGF